MVDAVDIRILFAEDVSTDREMAERLLRDSGMSFVSDCVESEVEFRAALRSFRPTLILSDFRMPSFNGMEALKIALEEQPDIPFIILTGSMNEDVAVECMKAGADDYVIKQNLLRLVPAIRSAFEKKAAIYAERESREKVKKALAEKEVLLRELYHRTNNTMQLIRAIIGLKAGKHNNPVVSLFAKDIDQKIMAMSLVHQKLYKSQDLSHLHLNEYLSDLASMVLSASTEKTPYVTLKLEMETVRVLIDSAIPCGLILNELMVNSLAHAFEGQQRGQISISLSRGIDGIIELVYFDDGKGVADDFDFRNQSGLGLHFVVELVESQLSGSIACGKSHGLLYTIRFLDNLYTERI